MEPSLCFGLGACNPLVETRIKIRCMCLCCRRSIECTRTYDSSSKQCTHGRLRVRIRYDIASTAVVIVLKEYDDALLVPA